MKTILVTGGTGMIGRPVVDRLAAAGNAVRSLSRHARPGDGAEEAGLGPTGPTGTPGHTRVAVDLRTGEGLDAAIDGADTVVHLATTYTGGDTRSATNLIRASRRARVPHVLLISIVGVDRAAMPYYRTKRRVEQAFEASDLNWTLLRTTQFHGLVLKLCASLAKAPLMLAPSVPLQPIDSDEVADRLAELAVGDPAGRVPDMGGPQVEEFADLARTYLRWSGRRRPLVPLRLPGKSFAAYRAGTHLAPDRGVGRITFEEFLAARSGTGGPRGLDGPGRPDGANGRGDR